MAEIADGKPVFAAKRRAGSKLVDESANIGVIAKSILNMDREAGSSVVVEFESLEGFDSVKYSALDPVEKLTARKDLGISPR